MTIQRPHNALLQALSPPDWELLHRRLRPFELINGQVLAEAGDPVSWIVFPETGLVSVISILVSGSQVETSVIGRDGALGFIEALGSGRMNSRFLVQVPGQALRMPADEFRSAFQDSARMQRSVLQQIELLQAESRLAIACHSIHPVEGRLCRWLLECQEVSGKDEMPLTQELLGVMLSVQRTTVSKFAGKLQDSGLIEYRRGSVRIIDPKGLELRSCECRATLQHLKIAMAPETFSESTPSRERFEPSLRR